MNPLNLVKEPGDRLAAAVILVLIAVLPAYVWHENTSGFLTDDGMYLLLADFFSPYYDGNKFVDRLVIEQSRFPPAFPVLIGLLGGGSGSMHVAHLATAATFIFSALLFYIWSSRTLGSKELGAACLALYALLPKTLVYINEIWSEHLYMAFVFAAFVLIDMARRSREHARELLCACALFVGLALLTRTIGIALLAVFVLYLYVHAVRRKHLYILTALALPVCWQVIKMINGYGGGYAEDLDQYVSRDGLVKLLVSDIPFNLSVLMQSWGKHFFVSPQSSWLLQVSAGLLLLLSLIGGASRAADKRMEPYYVLLYIAILLVWPHPNHLTRLLYPVVPLLLVYMFIGLSMLIPATAARLRGISQPGLVLLILLMIYPNALFVVNRFLAPVPDHIPADYRHTRQWLRSDNMAHKYRDAERRRVVVELISRIDQHLAPHECAYAVHPVSTILYSRRRAILLPERVSVEKLTLCDYLFVMNLTGKFKANYPLGDIDLDRLTLLDTERDGGGQPQAFLFEIQR